MKPPRPIHVLDALVILFIGMHISRAFAYFVYVMLSVVFWTVVLVWVLSTWGTHTNGD